MSFRVGTLRVLPSTLHGLVAGVTEEEARWKPSPTRWSIIEVIGHLAHVEIHGFMSGCSTTSATGGRLPNSCVR